MCNAKANKKQRIYKRHSGICHYCGKLCNPFPNKGTHKDDASVDHIQTRAAGGNNHETNLVLACVRCNGVRSCIPYLVFVHKELWRPENKHLCAKFNRLFAIGVQNMKNEPEKQVYLLEMYMEDDEYGIDVQNWGVFESAQAVHRYINGSFPTAVLNEDDDLGYIGYHFNEDDSLADVSFVANAWDLQK